MLCIHYAVVVVIVFGVVLGLDIDVDGAVVLLTDVFAVGIVFVLALTRADWVCGQHLVSPFC